MSELSGLKNIGKTSAQWLREAGIYTRDDLQKLGAVEAWRRVKLMYPDRTSLVLLYALEGALLDLHWNQLPDELKAELREAARA